MGKLEILAPAGSEEALISAVRAGADAVYLATTSFGARASAKNFDYEQLKSAVEFCHRRGVKVYLTMNTLITDSELPTALDIAKKAYELPVDAIIVQDVGFADLLHKSMPALHLHGSTQMSVHTPQGAKLLYELGFTRVVLSREMTAKEIGEVAKVCPIELEVFVHGALCMSVSGQCYFSSLLGSRSGNRGQCAQTCRLPFMVEGGTGHDLSLKDMSILEHLRELDKIGVTSAKIEGRLKRPEYVASAVNVARQFYDNGYATPESQILLKSVFSRSGFTDGYYNNCRGAEMFGTRQKEDVISATTKILNNIHNIYKNEYQHIPLLMNFYLKRNEQAKLVVNVLETDIQVVVYGEDGEQAINKPLTEEKCNEQLLKTGGTPYKVISTNSEIQENTTIPISVINKMRRQALSEITDKLCLQYKSEKPIDIPLQKTETRKSNTNIPLRAIFSDYDIPDKFAECEIVFIPENTPEKFIKGLKEKGFNLGLEISGGMFGREDRIRKNLEKAKNNNISHILINNIGAISLCKEYDMKIHGNFRLNIVNTESVGFFERLGLSDVVCSFEMTLQQINSLGGNMPIGTLIYGRLPLMLTRNCPGVNSKTKSCSECGGLGYITDRKDISFPYKCNNGCTQIFNSVPLYMGDRLREIETSDFYVMLFTVENKEEKEYALECIKQKSKIQNGHTRGLYYKGVL